MVKKHLKDLFANTLALNSFYLLLATGVTAIFGFFFWFISSKLYSTTNIGIATTLISIMNTISLLSIVGFDSAFVRFLPKSSNPNEKINTGFTIVTLVSVVLASVFLVFVERISPSLSFIAETPGNASLFILFCVMTSLNILSDSVFVSKRRAVFSLSINFIFSAFRLLLPFALMSMGALGIFASIGISQTIGIILSVIVMIWKFDYKPSIAINLPVLRMMHGYILSNYIAVIFNLLPAAILPIMITNHLGPENAAFYYIIMMIGNLMYAIPWATTRSLFAEGSHEGEKFFELTMQASKIIGIFLIPTILVLYFFGDTILSLFGKNYSNEGFAFLQLIALSGIVVSIYSTMTSYFRVKKDARWLILINLSFAASILGASYLFLPYGLVGIGYAWIAGHIVAIVVGGIILLS